MGNHGGIVEVPRHQQHPRLGEQMRDGAGDRAAHHARHHHIGHDHINRGELIRGRQRLLATGHRHHPMPGTREGAENELTDGGIIVDEQNLLRHRGHRRKSPLSHWSDQNGGKGRAGNNNPRRPTGGCGGSESSQPGSNR